MWFYCLWPKNYTFVGLGSQPWSVERNLFLRLFFKLRLVYQAEHLEFRALARLWDENFGAPQVVKHREK